MMQAINLNSKEEIYVSQITQLKLMMKIRDYMMNYVFIVASYKYMIHINKTIDMRSRFVKNKQRRTCFALLKPNKDQVRCESGEPLSRELFEVVDSFLQ